MKLVNETTSTLVKKYKALAAGESFRFSDSMHPRFRVRKGYVRFDNGDYVDTSSGCYDNADVITLDATLTYKDQV
jgi:hypothetical protein